MPYLFTAKELDEETGLYYYGARYYDPRTSVWQSGDPVLGKYLPDLGDPIPLKLAGLPRSLPHFDLPGHGGVFNTSNLGLYSYTHLNPVRLRDPDGRWSTEAHNYFIDQAFPHLPDRTRTYIKEGSRAADAWYNQLTGDHIHSMWPEGGSAETMARLRSEYIASRLEDFSDLMTKAIEFRGRGAVGLAENFEARAWRDQRQDPV